MHTKREIEFTETHRNGPGFYIYNTHYDDNGVERGVTMDGPFASIGYANRFRNRLIEAERLATALLEAA